MDISIGSVVDPVTFWVGPSTPPDWLVQMEKDLSRKFEKPKIASADSLEDVTSCCSSGSTVAVKNEHGPEWCRAEMFEELAYYPKGPQAKFFLVDSGRVTDYLELRSHVRCLPSRYQLELNNETMPKQAVKVTISDLVPISRQIDVRGTWMDEAFRPILFPKWTESALRLVENLVKNAERCALTNLGSIQVDSETGYSTVSAEVEISLESVEISRLSRFGNKDLICGFPLDQKNKINLKELLLAQGHAIQVDSKSSVMKSKEEMKHQFTLLDDKIASTTTTKSRYSSNNNNSNKKKIPNNELNERKDKIKREFEFEKKKQKLLRDVRDLRIAARNDSSSSIRDHDSDEDSDDFPDPNSKQVWDQMRHPKLRRPQNFSFGDAIAHKEVHEFIKK